MQLSLHNSDMLIPNLSHAKLFFLFFPFKIDKQNGRQNIRYNHNHHDYTSCMGAQRTHKLDFRVQNNHFVLRNFMFKDLVHYNAINSKTPRWPPIIQKVP